MRLYHFTDMHRLQNGGTILKEGLKPKGDPWLPPADVVWLTANEDPEFMFVLDDDTLDPGWKTNRCRITVGIPSTDKRLVRWEKWILKQRVIQIPDRNFTSGEYINVVTAAGIMTGTGGEWKNYYAYFGAIPFRKIRKVEYADPVKRAKAQAKL
jgi:hypothetical protein